ncbi:MAG TPA: SAM-dependent chlorinase/fluorinase [Acidimicrobiales bacterium]|nr:SAM-dependent chlorinase/fluorinase [Acidimicrobiales bacterium]
MAPRFDTISFLSDYGTRDEFVGVVKSVIRSIAPHVAVVDITHEIAPYDTRGAALTLARSVQYLCPGVVLAIVDPGVGTDRRALAVEVGGGQSFLIGPDNGVLASAADMSGGATAAVELTNPAYQLPAPGPTFAGRDVFAPAAAHLAAGVPAEELGAPVDLHELVPGIMPLAREERGTIVGEVLWVDRYGNCQLNVDPEALDPWGERVQLRWTRPRPATRAAVRVHTYGELKPRQVGLLVDSYGLLAVSMARASAADDLGLEAGDEIVLASLDDGPGDGDVGGGPTSPVHLQPRRRA